MNRIHVVSCRCFVYIATLVLNNQGFIQIGNLDNATSNTRGIMTKMNADASIVTVVA